MKRKIQLLGILFLMLIIFLGCSDAQKSAEKSSPKDAEVTIYLARHGKTMLNTTQRVQGWADSPLTDEGITGARNLGKGLEKAGIDFDAVYSSDLGRAKQTAVEVLDAKNQSLKIQEQQGLREICFGKYEGELVSKMWDDMAQSMGYQNQEQLNQAINKGQTTTAAAYDAMAQLDDMGMAEDYKTVQTRMEKTMIEIADKALETGDENVLVVSHGVAIGALLTELTDDYNGQGLSNASICKLSYKNGNFKVESINDTSYVKNGAN
ncbi:histidine phosphatase family protein [Listeria costaricensis]|uniref:histidine phosphatase family protein n=1 Tax=Listeria costaricensis TaxID=2026604 RepID=UPI000C085D2E|nr:histidine phosphatase family protein [Listeria costaricensis]